MRRTPHLSAAVGLFALLACDRPAVRDDLGVAREAIQGGSLDTTHAFAVGVCPGFKGSCLGVCSGALIAPNLVITARHCVDEIENRAPTGGVDCAMTTFAAKPLANTFWITTDPNMKQGTSGWYQVKSIARAPSSSSPTKLCGNDLALLLLAGNVPSSVATPITPAVQRSISSRPPYGAKINAIGYGVTGPTPAEENTSGTRRIRTGLSIRCIPGDPEIDCPAEVAGAIDQREFLVSQGTCAGDSGSSAYEQISFNAGTPVSFGVLSRGGESGTTCQTPIYSRLDSWSSFIVATAKQAATAGGYKEPDWTVPLPVIPDAGPDSGPTLKANGAACTKDTDCKSKHCVASSEEGSVCALECDPSDDPSVCDDTETCREVDGVNYCLPPVPAVSKPLAKDDSSGCTASAPGASGALSSGAFALVLGLFVAFRRRRRN